MDFTKELPYKVIFSITDKCNNRCKTCNIWRKDKSNELSLGEIRKIFKKYGKIRWLSMTGGEPFLRDDLYKIAYTTIENNPLAILNIPTNGSKPEKIKKTVCKILQLKIPFVYVTISLDGPPEVHNRLRGREGSWQNAVETYKKLEKLKDMHLNVYFEHLISPFNLGEFESCVNTAKEKIPGNRDKRLSHNALPEIKPLLR